MDRTRQELRMMAWAKGAPATPPGGLRLLCSACRWATMTALVARAPGPCLEVEMHLLADAAAFICACARASRGGGGDAHW